MKPESEFLFVEVAALRCLQLMRGARPKIDANVRKYTTLAVKETDAGVVPWALGPRKDTELVATAMEEPISPESDGTD